MKNALSYFQPPFEGSWRVVQVQETPERIRIEWLQEDSLATDWEISLVSVTQVRTRRGPPDPDEALAAGLLPVLTDGSALAQIHEESAEQVLFVCAWSGDFAKSDQTLAVRLRVDGDYLIGIVCRMRPPIAGGAATALLEQMHAAPLTAEAPAAQPLDPAHDERFRPQLDPYLRALDEAMEHNDIAYALDTIETLRPTLTLAPLSRFALNIHISEGWAHMRSAFAGEAQAAGRAIELVRRTLDNIEPAEQPDLYRAGAMWLAEAYSKREEAGDAQHAIEAYRAVSNLSDARAHPVQVAHAHLRMGILHQQLGRALKAEQAERLLRAHAELDHAEALYATAQDTAGLAEVALAKADAMRLLGGAQRAQDAADLYVSAWDILVREDAQEALGNERYDAMLEHVQSSMHALDALKFGPPRLREVDEDPPAVELERKGLLRRMRPRGTENR
jgi:tetratricopeptide (TPR) repeat protein